MRRRNNGRPPQQAQYSQQAIYPHAPAEGYTQREGKYYTQAQNIASSQSQKLSKLTQKRIDRKKSIEEKNKRKRNYKGFIYSFFLTILGTIVLIVLIVTFISKVTIHTVKLSGNITIPKELLQSQIKLDLPQKYFDVNIRDIKDRLEAHPLIYEAHVSKGVTGHLNITLERSNPLVTLLAEVNGEYKPVYFDKLGRCVQVGTGLGLVDVPILSGLSLVNPAVGVYLPEWVQDILKDLNDVKIDNENLYKQISELSIKDLGDSYRVLRITFTGLKSKFITNLNFDTTTIMKIWQLANKIENSTDPLLSSFSYFDVRQGVIIGKKERQDESASN